MKRIGVVSDTHGTLHQSAVSHLDGVDEIIHAGDIGRESIIDQLEAVAPVRAISGNVDWGSRLGRQYPRVISTREEDVQLLVKHIGGVPADWYPRLSDPVPDVAICGHSHEPLCRRHNGVLFLNPGAAGRPRFGRGCSLAILTLDAGAASARLIHLK